MSKLQILMPMGGLGSRFANAGYTTPKPLIKVDGKYMFLRALESFSPIKNIDYIFVIRDDQDKKYKLKDAILSKMPEAKVSIIYNDTRGAVETCMVAEHYIDDESPISIADCDIFFESSAYFNKIQGNKNTLPDGMLLTFDSDDPRYSYAKIDINGRVIKTAEKIVISNNAILGGYFFKSGALFKELAKDFLSKPLPSNLKEFYLSHMFNLILDKGGLVEVAKIDSMAIFGTPEELEQYNAKKSAE